MLFKSLIFLFFFFTFSSYSIEHITKNVNIIFVHGIGGGFEDWEPMVKESFGEEFNRIRYDFKGNLIHTATVDTDISNVWIVSYYSTNAIKESFFGHLQLYTDRLGNILDKITELTGNDRFILIAHSMGGLVSRNLMVKSQERWDSVYKILTVGTPHNGVRMSVGVTGQFRDLVPSSKFFKSLNARWNSYYDISKNKKWGVIGAYHPLKSSKKLLRKGKATDLGGPGWVAIYSSIPHKEWKDALNFVGKSVLDTPFFGFRALVVAGHHDLLIDPITRMGIDWTLK